MYGHTSLVYLMLIYGENGKIKIAKITPIINFWHPTYKNKFKYFNFINRPYYFVNVFIYQLFYALFFHENPFLY